VDVWTPLQDACCTAPSDWLDAGQSDSYVTAVPSGFVREVVVDVRCYNTKNTRGGVVHVKEPTVYYHYFEEVLVGPERTRKVHRTALLRAAKRGGGKGKPKVPAEETVEGFMAAYPYVRSWGRLLQLKDFVFETGTRKAATAAVAKPTPAATTGTRNVAKAATAAVAKPTPAAATGSRKDAKAAPMPATPKPAAAKAKQVSVNEYTPCYVPPPSVRKGQ